MDLFNHITKSLKDWKNLNVNKQILHKGIYIPNGEKCELTVRYNTKTLEPISQTWRFPESAVSSTMLSEKEMKMFKSLSLTPSISEVTLDVVFKMIRCGKAYSDPTSPESLHTDFVYVYAVCIQDPEDEEDVTWLPLEKWANVRFLKKKERIFNAQDIHCLEVDLSSIGEELINSISKFNPFASNSEERKKGNGILFLPDNNFLFQRLENWVLINSHGEENTDFAVVSV